MNEGGGAMRRATCRSCGAAIVWTLTEAGRRMPVDLEPADDGTLRLEESQDGSAVVYAFVVRGNVRPREELYRSHFSTCPNATQHRNPRGRA